MFFVNEEFDCGTLKSDGG